MAVYAIGDLQGCYDPFCRLLDAIAFDPERDRLWLVGDLVNRGEQSLEVLRTVYQLRRRVRVVLGNHDLALLRLWLADERSRTNADLNRVLDAPDAEQLLDWLRHRPLLRLSEKHNAALVHAGIPPSWSIKFAKARAREVQQVLRSDDAGEFLANMFGSEPSRWSNDLSGDERLRFIVNAFTRMRTVRADGSLDLSFSGPPESAPTELAPWFEVAKRPARSTRIIFGHWSALGLVRRKSLLGLDTGCVWGRELTAVRIDKPNRHPVQISCNA